jgi:hypothetical protein
MAEQHIPQQRPPPAPHNDGGAMNLGGLLQGLGGGGGSPQLASALLQLTVMLNRYSDVIQEQLTYWKQRAEQLEQRAENLEKKNVELMTKLDNMAEKLRFAGQETDRAP